MVKLTREQLAERERITDEIITEILNEEAIVDELPKLDLRERQKHDQYNWYWESDNDFLDYGHNHKAAAILLDVYLRTIAKRAGQSKS